MTHVGINHKTLRLKLFKLKPNVSLVNFATMCVCAQSNFCIRISRLLRRSHKIYNATFERKHAENNYKSYN